MRVLGLVWFGSVWVLWSLFGNYSSYQSWIILSNVLLIVLLFLLYLLNFFNTLYSDYGFPPKSSHWNPDSFFLCVIRKQISTSSSAGFPELWGERFDSDTLIVCAHCPVVGLCICSICCRKKLFWWCLSKGLVYEYSRTSLEGILLLISYSRTAVFGLTLGLWHN